MHLLCTFLDDTSHSLLQFCDVTFHSPPLVRDEAMRLQELGARHGAAFLHVGDSSAGVGIPASLELFTFGRQCC